MALNFFSKGVRINNTVIALFSMTFIGTILLLLQALGFFEPKMKLMFERDIKDSDANDFIAEFRDDLELRRKTALIWYSETAVQDYMRTTFADWKAKMPLPPNLNDSSYQWGLGFYPMRHTDHNGYKNRVDFAVIPTILKRIRHSNGTFDSVIFDFHDQDYKKYYNKNGQTITGLCPDCTGYDAGHLWP